MAGETDERHERVGVGRRRLAAHLRRRTGLRGHPMLQGALAGLGAGGLYATLAVCLTLMSRLVRVVNFAQAATAMMGSYVAVWLVSDQGWAVWPATGIGIVIGAALSALVGLIITTWLPEAPVSSRSAVTVAALLLLMSLSFILFGNKPQPYQPLISGPAFDVGSVVVSKVTVLIVLLAVVIAACCRVVLSHSTVGIKLRALSERPTTAELTGIPARPYAVSVWAVTGAFATLVIALIAPSQSNDAVSLAMLVVPSAAAALLGGFRRLDLAVAGGLVLGALEGAAAQLEQLSIARHFIPLLAIVGLLLWRQRKEVWDAAR